MTTSIHNIGIIISFIHCNYKNVCPPNIQQRKNEIEIQTRSSERMSETFASANQHNIQQIISVKRYFS